MPKVDSLCVMGLILLYGTKLVMISSFLPFEEAPLHLMAER